MDQGVGVEEERELGSKASPNDECEDHSNVTLPQQRG